MQTRRGLEIIIDAAASLFDQRSLQRLAEGVLTQLSSLMAVDCAGILVLRETGVRRFKVLAGSGVYKEYVAPGGSDEVEDEIAELIHKGFDSRRHDFTVGRYVLYMGTGSGRELVALMEADRELTDTDKALVEVFCSRLSAAFDNVTLYEELERANQRLEEKVARRTAQLLAAKERLENQSERLKQRQRLQERGARNRRARPEEPARRDPRPHRDPERAALCDEAAGEGRARPDRPYPPVGAPPDRHGRGSDRRRAGGRGRHLGARLQPRFRDCWSPKSRRATASLPAAKEQELHVAFEPGLRVRGDTSGCARRSTISSAMRSNTARSADASTFRAAREGEDAVVRVADQGPGLSPEDIGRVFGRFQRLSAKPTGGESSTGLGLSIAKRIIELHKGRIFVESRGSAGGAVFAIALPLLDEADAQ